MRRIMNIFAVLTVLVLASCQRRPFAENTTEVNLVLSVNTQIVNNDDSVQLPETMRLNLYDPQTGELRYTDFISPTGGVIYPLPGDYDLVVYNMGTESTQVRNHDSFSEMEAFTSEVSAFLKSQLHKFLEMRSKLLAKAEPAAVEEKIVYEPDHLFVGHVRSVNIPAILEGEQQSDITIEVDAHTVVETWNITLDNVDGIEWVSNVSAIISGQAESHFIGRQEDSENPVSIYFEMKPDTKNGTITGKFNTFGKHPSVQSDLSLDLNVVDTGGEEHHYHFDVNSDFFDNPELDIVVEEEVKIEEPVSGGGGFVPTVNDWEEVKTEINI